MLFTGGSASGGSASVGVYIRGEVTCIWGVCIQGGLYQGGLHLGRVCILGGSASGEGLHPWGSAFGFITNNQTH